MNKLFRYILCLYLSSTCGALKAQSWTYGSHKNENSPLSKVWITSDEVNIIQSEIYFGFATWIKLDKNGKLLWRNWISTDYIMSQPLPNGKLIMYDTDFECDFRGTSQLVLVNDAGLIKNKIFNLPQPRGIHIVNNSQYWLYYSSSITYINANFTVTSQYNLPINTISSIANQTNSTVVISAKSNSVPCLFRYTNNLIKIDSVTVPTLFYEMNVTQNGQIIASGSDGILYRYSPSLTPLVNSSALSYKFKTDQAIKNDTIIGLSMTSNSIQALVFMDTSFQIIRTSTLSTNLRKLTSVCFKDNSIITVSHLFQANINQLGIQCMAMNEEIGYQQDVGIRITDVRFDSYYEYDRGYIYDFNIDVVVNNNGARYIDSVRFSRNYGINFLCGPVIKSQNIRVDLQPGSSTKITLANYGLASSSPSNLPTTFKICVLASIPNKEIDLITENNEGCYDFNTSILSLFEVESPQTIAPNPFHSCLNIKQNVAIEKIKVFNLEGQLLYEFEPSSNEVELSTADWKNGMYLIECISTSGITHKKVIKN
jgi:hypothetical protein